MTSLEKPSLSTIPPEILEKIVQNVDVKGRVSIQKCSKSLYTHVSNANVTLPKAEFLIEKFQIYIPIHHEGVMRDYVTDYAVYSRHPIGCRVSVMKYRGGRPPKYVSTVSEKIVPGMDYLERAISDFAAIFFTRRAKIENFTIDRFGYEESFDSTNIFNYFKKILSDRNNTIPVKEFVISLKGVTPEEAQCIVPYLEPQYLTELIVFDPFVESKWEEITSLSHWKEAKEISFGISKVPVKEFVHFEKIGLKLENLTFADFQMIIRSGLKPEKDNFYSFLTCNTVDPAIAPYLRSHFRQFPEWSPWMIDKVIEVPNKNNHFLRVTHYFSIPPRPTALSLKRIVIN